MSISLKLKLTEEVVKKEPVKTEAMPAIDKQPGLKQIIKEDVVLDKATSDTVEKLLIALKKKSDENERKYREDIIEASFKILKIEL